ncbi:MAG: hypothetical protein RR980_05210 [Mucinivorans sp.]
MKTVFLSYNQSLAEQVTGILDKQSIKGFTQWFDVSGSGSYSGEPHLGSHTWPAKNTVIIAIMDDHRVEPLLESLRELDSHTERQGLRAFVWNVENQL